MSEAVGRLREAVADVVAAAGRSPDEARGRWLSYVTGAWVQDLPELAEAQVEAVAALQALGMAGSSGDGWASRMRDHQRQIRDAARDRIGIREVGPEDGRSVREVLETMGCPGLPERIDMPEGYSIDRAGVHRLDEDRTTTIARAPLVITGAGTDAVTGARYLRLAWRLPGGGWRVRSVERGRVMQARQLVELADEGAPVTSVSAAAVVAYLDAMEAEVAPHVPVVSVVRHSGWTRDGSSYLLGSHVVGPDPDRYVLEAASDGEAQWYGHVQRSGTWSGWLEAWEAVRAHPRAAVAAYAAAAPALRGVIPAMPGACIEWSGLTSGGKSVALALAASVWGSGALIRRWDATGVGAEVAASAARDMPLMLDDTKALLSGGSDRRREAGASTITATIYLATGATGRLRGSTTGLREQREVRTWLLSTSETPSIDLASDIGIRPRTLTLRGRPLGDDPVAGEIAATVIGSVVAEHYGHLGMRVVAWLAGGGAVQAREWYRRHLAEARHGSAIERRLSQLIAAIQTSADVCEAVGLPRADVIEDVIDAARYSVRSADTHAAALRALWGVAMSQGRIAGIGGDDTRHPPGGWIGELSATEGSASLVQSTTHAELRRLGYDPPEIVERWRQAGWLHLTPSGRTRTTVTVARASRVAGYRLTADGIAEARGEVDE